MAATSFHPFKNLQNQRKPMTLDLRMEDISHITSLFKVRKRAKIKNQFNEVPHLTQDTNGKVRHHEREPKGQPFPSRWPQGNNKQTRTSRFNGVNLTFSSDEDQDTWCLVCMRTPNLPRTYKSPTDTVLRGVATYKPKRICVHIWSKNTGRFYHNLEDSWWYVSKRVRRTNINLRQNLWWCWYHPLIICHRMRACDHIHFFKIYHYKECAFIFANSTNPDETPHYLSLRCFYIVLSHNAFSLFHKCILWILDKLRLWYS